MSSLNVRTFVNRLRDDIKCLYLDVHDRVYHGHLLRRMDLKVKGLNGWTNSQQHALDDLSCRVQDIEKHLRTLDDSIDRRYYEIDSKLSELERSADTSMQTLYEELDGMHWRS